MNSDAEPMLGLDRQKTIDVKTWCPCSQNARVPFGGKGRGYWCGACLQIRMGQNINEVMAVNGVLTPDFITFISTDHQFEGIQQPFRSGERGWPHGRRVSQS